MKNKSKIIEIEIPEGIVAKWVDGVHTLIDEKPQDVTERIKTFVDACRELGSDHPFLKAYDDYLFHIHQDNMNDYDLVAYLQLRIITAALNEGWDPQFTKGEYRWCVWCERITKEQYDKLSVKNSTCVVCRGGSYAKLYCGLVYVGSLNPSPDSNAVCGSRLVFKSKKLAAYAIRQFTEIYADFCFKPNKLG